MRQWTPSSRSLPFFPSTHVVFHFHEPLSKPNLQLLRNTLPQGQIPNFCGSQTGASTVKNRIRLQYRRCTVFEVTRTKCSLLHCDNIGSESFLHCSLATGSQWFWSNFLFKIGLNFPFTVYSKKSNFAIHAFSSCRFQIMFLLYSTSVATTVMHVPGSYRDNAELFHCLFPGGDSSWRSGTACQRLLMFFRAQLPLYRILPGLVYTIATLAT